MAEELSSTAGDRRSFLQAKRWYSWLATLVANWPADTQRKISVRSVPQEAGRAEDALVRVQPRGASAAAAAAAAATVAAAAAAAPAAASVTATATTAVVTATSEAAAAAPALAGGGQGGAADRRRRRSRSRGRTLAESSKEPRSFGKGHRVFMSGSLYWCRTCGAYAEFRFKSLKEACPGEADGGPRAGQLARMVKGEHPLKKGERMPRPVGVNRLWESQLAMAC